MLIESCPLRPRPDPESVEEPVNNGIVTSDFRRLGDVKSVLISVQIIGIPL